MLRRFFGILTVFTLALALVPLAPVQAGPADGSPAPAVLPLEAQVEFSAEIGQVEPGYHFVSAGEGYTARSAGAGLEASLDASAARVTAGDQGWNLRLQGWGYGQARAAGQPLELAGAGNRVEYRYPGLVEWYRNGPLGLQQGFTISQPPEQPQVLILALDLGTFTAQLDPDRRGATLADPRGTACFEYAGLQAYDAAGRSLPARLETGPFEGRAALLVRVETEGALYPLTVDPIVRQVRLTASEAEGENFGSAVALSQDGHTALVGAYGANVADKLGQGAAYVFSLEQSEVAGGTPTYAWTYQARLSADMGIAKGSAGDRFGVSVALSADGNIALVGADRMDVGGHADQGAAYVFVRTDGAWSEESILVTTDGAEGDYFGWALDLNDAGSLAVIGAYNADADGAVDNGAAYVFSRGGTVWTPQGKLQQSCGAGAMLGFSVAMDPDGDVVLLGAQGYDQGGLVNPGLVAYYRRSGATWTYSGALMPTTPVDRAYFGRSLSINDSGDLAVVGAPGTLVGSNASQGAAYMFGLVSGVWTQQSTLLAQDGAGNDQFGVAVFLQGSSVYVGAHLANVGAQVDQGAVYRFNRLLASPTWIQAAKYTASDGGSGDLFGVSIAVGDSGVLIGARRADPAENMDQGAAYSRITDPGGRVTELKLSGSGSGSAEFGFEVALSDNGQVALVGDPWAYQEGRLSQGAAYIFTRSGSTWTQSARIVAADGAAGDRFGNSVALSGDGQTVLIGAPQADVGANLNQGAVYMYTHTGAAWSQTNWILLHKITYASGKAEDKFGWAVALSDNAKIALIGAPLADANNEFGTNAGMAVFYDFTPTTPTTVAFFGDFTDYNFGEAVALSGVGSTALIGAPGTGPTGMSNDSEGAAHVYQFNGSAWNRQTTLQASDHAKFDEFGSHLALSDDGNAALVGVPRKYGSGQFQGAAYAFRRNLALWTTSQKLTASDGAAMAQFGWSVALNGDGSLALIGAIGAGAGGKAYAFARAGTWTQRNILSGSESSANYGYAAALNDSGWTGLLGANDGGGYQQGAVYAVPNPAGAAFYLPMVRR